MAALFSLIMKQCCLIIVAIVCAPVHAHCDFFRRIVAAFVELIVHGGALDIRHG